MIVKVSFFLATYCCILLMFHGTVKMLCEVVVVFFFYLIEDEFIVCRPVCVRFTLDLAFIFRNNLKFFPRSISLFAILCVCLFVYMFEFSRNEKESGRESVKKEWMKWRWRLVKPFIEVKFIKTVNAQMKLNVYVQCIYWGLATI